MSYFPEMEWSGKWDWENIAAFGSKTVESQKKPQLTDWSVVDEGSFNLSGGGSGSGSDGGHGSSSKSSISASESSTKDGMRWSNTGLITFDGSSGNFTKKMGMMKESEISGSSQQLDASFSSGEPVMGLKLGKRTYFENNGTGGNVKNTFLSAMPSGPSISEQKKTKASTQNALLSTCQVQGCNVDLSAAKEYHRKHRVCNVHSKCPKVIIGGLERRFCQQCSRFHSLSEFDDKKRSCRNRLSDHNARRRKPHPHQESIQFNSTGMTSPFYGVMQQMAFLSNNSPVMYSGAPAKSTWDNTPNPKFTLTNGYLLKSNGDLGIHEQLQMPDMKLPNIISRRGNPANGLLTSKSYPHGILSTGSKGSMISTPHLDAAPEYRRALSLLSSNSNTTTWVGGSCEPQSIQHHQNDYNNNHSNIIPQPVMTNTMNTIPEGVPLSSGEIWQTSGHHTTTLPRFQPFGGNANFQGIQHFKPPYEADFYSNMMN